MDEEREDTVSSGAAVYFRKKGEERERERERERREERDEEGECVYAL